jgi:hypothetical protein
MNTLHIAAARALADRRRLRASRLRARSMALLWRRARRALHRALRQLGRSLPPNTVQAPTGAAFFAGQPGAKEI